MRYGTIVPLLMVFALIVGASETQAQTPFEALRYSQLRSGNTARGLAVGGAFGALGADFSSLSINPGGLAVYRRSEIMGTIQVVNNVSESNYNGSPFRYNQVRGNLGNLGLVITSLFEDRRGNRSRGKWVSVNFGIGHNRLADFNSRVVLTDDMAYNSYLLDLREELNTFGGQINLGNFSAETVAAYEAYLLNPESVGYSAVTDGNFVDQQLVLRTEGGIDELTFAVASNYNNKVYFGMSIGIPFLNYEEELVVRERDVSDTIQSFNSYSIVNKLATDGTGINARFGLIVKPWKYIRLGAAFHTPTKYGMNDRYTTDVNSSIDTLGTITTFNNGEFEYRFSSPLRTVISAAGLIKNYGFISVDYEYANYGNARYRFPNNFIAEETELNDWVGATLTSVHTIRAGAEAAIKNFRVRAGYAYSTTPLEQPENYDAGFDWTSMTYSGGIGFKKERFFVDFTYFRVVQKSMLQLASNITSTNTLAKDNFVMTFGISF